MCVRVRGEKKKKNKCDVDKPHEQHLTKRGVTVHKAEGKTAGGGGEDAAQPKKVGQLRNRSVRRSTAPSVGAVVATATDTTRAVTHHGLSTHRESKMLHRKTVGTTTNRGDPSQGGGRVMGARRMGWERKESVRKRGGWGGGGTQRTKLTHHKHKSRTGPDDAAGGRQPPPTLLSTGTRAVAVVSPARVAGGRDAQHTQTPAGGGLRPGKGGRADSEAKGVSLSVAPRDNSHGHRGCSGRGGAEGLAAPTTGADTVHMAGGEAGSGGKCGHQSRMCKQLAPDTVVPPPPPRSRVVGAAASEAPSAPPLGTRRARGTGLGEPP